MEVHDAISKHEIISVKIAWVKFLQFWRQNGPGFYAGVNISKQGSWSCTCLRVASTRYVLQWNFISTIVQKECVN